MIGKIILPDLVELIEKKRYDELKAALSELFPQDIAELIEDMEDDERKGIVFRILPKLLAIDVFENLSHTEQKRLLLSFSNTWIKDILADMSPDDRTFLLEELPAKVVKTWIKLLSPEDRVIVNTLLNYPEESVGRLLTPDFVDLRLDMTAEQAIKRIRRIGLDKETVFYLYVIDERRTLRGIVSLKDLVLADPDALMANIMSDECMAIHARDDRESAVALAQKYDLIALPVLDDEHRLVGIVTIDDLVDVIEEEVTEDFQKMAAMIPSEQKYFETSLVRLLAHRVVWLILLLFTGGISGSIMKTYEPTIQMIVSLTFFIPMLLGTFGNSGTQSATLIIRGLATGEIELEDFLAVVRREVMIGLLLGVILGVLGFLRVYLTQHDFWLSLATGLSFVCALAVATLAGSALPLLFKRLKLDPAVLAGPSITTIMDVMGLIIYFEMAKWLVLPRL